MTIKKQIYSGVPGGYDVLVLADLVRRHQSLFHVAAGEAHLQQMKDELNHRYMIIYSLEDRQIENLHLFYGQEKDGKNQQLLEQVLVSKSEAIPSPKVYKKRMRRVNSLRILFLLVITFRNC